MRKILTIFFLVSLLVYPQSYTFDFHSPGNIIKFADHLFCENDYLRAVEEYESIKSVLMNDTIDFKIMLCYSELGMYQMSNLSKVPFSNSVFKKDAVCLSVKNRFKEFPESFYLLSEISTYPFSLEDSSTLNYFQKLSGISYLLGNYEILPKDKIINPFESSDKKIISDYYNWKADPPYKSPALAGILSAVIPGSGKMYVGEWGDGITALVVTSLFTLLAYDNFRADHTTRAWIFTGLGAFFYAGNIYGSIASAQIFNARIDFEFNNGLKVFLVQKNYFLPEYDFCR